MARLTFALRMMRERWQKERSLCPYCQSMFSFRLQRKWMLIEARQCAHCRLIYRWPTDPVEGVRDFYEKGYEGQQATDVPRPLDVKEMVATDFANTQFDKKDRVAFLEQTLGTPYNRTLLDFGCSWGYSLWQYRATGWRASGLELSRDRAEYGRKHLGVDIRGNLHDYADERFDVIVADHSLEHVGQLGSVLAGLAAVSAENSALVIFVPNGSSRAARRLGVHWGPLIGESHTIAFTMEWFARNLARHGWKPRFYDSNGTSLSDSEYLVDHEEICVVARRPESVA